MVRGSFKGKEKVDVIPRLSLRRHDWGGVAVGLDTALL